MAAQPDHRGGRAGVVRVVQQRGERRHLAERREAAQVGERRAEGGRRHRPVAGLARVDAPGRGEDERHARGLVPERPLAPVTLLAEMEAVVAPQRDDRAVGAPRLEGREQLAHEPVEVVAAGQVGGHGLVPEPAPEDDRVRVRRQPRELSRGARHVGEVVLAHGRQAGVLGAERGEEVPRREPGQVRAAEADGQEQRRLACLAQLLRGPGDQLAVARLERREVVRSPVEAARDAVVRPRLGQSHGGGEVLAPGRLVDDGVEDLAAAQGLVAVAAHVLGQRDGVRQPVAEGDAVAVEPVHRRRDPGEHAGARRVAGRRRAVRVAKEHAARGQAVDVRRAGLRVAAQAPRPVVEVVDDDQQDVGTLPPSAAEQGERGQRGERGERLEEAPPRPLRAPGGAGTDHPSRRHGGGQAAASLQGVSESMAPRRAPRAGRGSLPARRAKAEVPEVGLEPTRLAAADFKSAASASFATPAGVE